MAAPIAVSGHGDEFLQSQVSSDSHSNAFSAFISDGVVLLVGDGKQVPIKILRDTGALDSFVLESVFPFSPMSDTGGCVLDWYRAWI